MKRWSIRRRLTLAVVVLVACSLVGIGALLLGVVQHAAWQQYDDGLLARAHAIGYAAEHDDDGYEIKLAPEAPGFRDTYTEVWLPTGDVLERSASLGDRDLARSSAFATTDGKVFRNVTLPDGRSGRSVEIHVLPRSEGEVPAQPILLVHAEDTQDVDNALATVRMYFAIIGVVALIAIAAVTLWLLSRALSPLRKLATNIESIDGSALAKRIVVDNEPAELLAPISKLNELLSRLENAFGRERQFTADVSHELRTPLAGLRTLLEVTTIVERDSAAYKRAIADALAIVLQMATMIDNLLMLARIDGGQVEVEVEDVALYKLVNSCWRPHQATAAQRSLTFSNKVSTDAIFRGDGEKLRIVVGNLLSNAVEYTTAGGSIEVVQGDALLEVRDSGPAIPLDQLERIFDRLWRSDAARSATGLHCGIGLSLARSLCTCMNMSIDAANTPDGGVMFAVRPKLPTH
jgi:signal transduction histidine kinase